MTGRALPAEVREQEVREPARRLLRHCHPPQTRPSAQGGEQPPRRGASPITRNYACACPALPCPALPCPVMRGSSARGAMAQAAGAPTAISRHYTAKTRRRQPIRSPCGPVEPRAPAQAVPIALGARMHPEASARSSERALTLSSAHRHHLSASAPVARVTASRKHGALVRTYSAPHSGER